MRKIADQVNFTFLRTLFKKHGAYEMHNTDNHNPIVCTLRFEGNPAISKERRRYYSTAIVSISWIPLYL